MESVSSLYKRDGLFRIEGITCNAHTVSDLPFIPAEIARKRADSNNANGKTFVAGGRR